MEPPPQGMAQQDPISPGVQRYSDEFMMYVYKVEMCKRVDKHDKEKCPYAHPGELARRRHPYLYQALPCPEARAKKICPRLENCNCSHSTFEFWLHPDRYKTLLCERGAHCTRPVCFFAHREAELRELPKGLQRTQVMHRLSTNQSSTASSSGTANSRGLSSRTTSTSLSAQLSSGSWQELTQQHGTGMQAVAIPSEQPGLLVSSIAAGPGKPSVIGSGNQNFGLPDYAGGALGPAAQQQQQQQQSSPSAAGQQQVVIGYPPVFAGQAQPPSMVVVRPIAARGSTVGVIPAGPSAWANASLGAEPGEAPSLEELCAAMGQFAVPVSEGLNHGLLVPQCETQQQKLQQQVMPVYAAPQQQVAVLSAKQLQQQVAVYPGPQMSMLAAPRQLQQQQQPGAFAAEQVQLPALAGQAPQVQPVLQGKQVVMMLQPEQGQQLPWDAFQPPV